MKPNPWWPRFNKSRTVSVMPDRILSRETRFLTMGSCFANEIRSALMQNGLTVLPETQPDLLPLFSHHSHEEASWGRWDDRVHLQYYNTYSIRQEFEKAFGHWEQAETDYWAVTMPDGAMVFQDPYRRSVFAPSLENLLSIIRGLDKALLHAIETADVFVFTLGLTEVWRLKHSQLYTCTEPGYRSGGGANSASFYASTYEDNLANMKRALDLLFAHYPDKKVFVTVSPVALGRTFRDIDIALANMESKSILRAVAGTLAASYANVTYFPSYEMCMYNQERAFVEDGRHVRRDQVEKIVSLFMSSYFPPEELTAPASDAPTERRKLEAVVADSLRRVMRVEDPDGQAVLDIFIAGYEEMAHGRPFPDDSYTAMRYINSATQGWLDRLVGERVSEMFPGPPPSDIASPLLGSVDRDTAEVILARLNNDGVYVFERKLSDVYLEHLRARVAETPLQPDGFFDSSILLRSEEIWSLIGDPVLLHLIGRYLDCEPIFQSANAMLARSGPTEAEDSYRFEIERLGSVKLWVHLTDVGEEGGPSLVVAGSHRTRPGLFWEDRTFTAEEILAHYPRELIRRTAGPAGTIVLIDDRTLHCQLSPRGERRMVQINYAASNAGKHCPSVVKRAENEFARKLSVAHPRLLTSVD